MFYLKTTSDYSLINKYKTLSSIYKKKKTVVSQKDPIFIYFLPHSTICKRKNLSRGTLNQYSGLIFFLP